MTKITRDEFIKRTKEEMARRKRRRHNEYVEYHKAVLDKQRRRSN
jgi:hypothetical protein